MKKILSLALSLVLLASVLLCFASCGGGKKGPQVLLDYGTLTVGVEIGYPPFEYFADDGTTPIGFDVELIAAVAEKLGLKVVYRNTGWDAIFAGLDTANYDVVCSAVTINSDRMENMLFSTPYINNYQALVVKVGSAQDGTVDGLEDLNGLAVALQDETTSDELLSTKVAANEVSCTINAFEQVTTAFSALANGEVQAVLADSTVADGYVASNPETYKIVWLQQDAPEQFGIAIRKGNTVLQSAINWAMAELEKEGKITELYDKWFAAAN